MALGNTQNKSLGRGLSSLLPENPKDEVKEGFQYIEIDKIIPNPYQPRQSIPIASIIELSESIKEKGVIMPITVVPNENKQGEYILAAGERRLSAAKLAGFGKIPAVIRKMDSKEMAEAAIIENIHRKDLNPMEEGYAYLRLIKDFNMETEEIGEKISKPKSYIEGKIQLTELPKLVQTSIAVGEITENHGRALLTLNDEKAIIATLKIIVRNSLNLKRTEELIRQIKLESGRLPKGYWTNKALEWMEKYSYVKDGLTEITGCEIKLKRNRKNGGSVVINFTNDEELVNIYKKLTGKK